MDSSGQFIPVSLAEQLPGVLYQFLMKPDGTGTMPFASQKLKDIFGIDPAEVRNTAQPIFDIIHPDDFVALQQSINDSATGVTNWACEFRIVRADGQQRWVSGVASPQVLPDGSLLWHGYILDVTAGKTRDYENSIIQQDLKEYDGFQRIVAGVSARFVNAVATDFNATVQDVLKIMGEYFAADRCYVFLFSPDFCLMTNTHEWCGQGIDPQIEDLQGFSVELLDWWWQQMKAKRTIIIPDLQAHTQMPEQEKKYLTVQGIQSLLCIPMINRGTLIGFMGLDRVLKKQGWTEKQVEQFNVLGEIVSSAFAKSLAEEALVESENHYRLLAGKARDLNNELLRNKKELEAFNQSLEERISNEVEKNRQLDHMMALQARQAALGEMIGNIAHQWRQPLNLLSLAVYDLSDAYQYKELDDRYMDNSIREINRIIQQMSKTIDDFRNYFRPQTLKTVFYAREAVNSALAFVSPYFHASGVQVEKNLPAHITVLGYSAQFEQVLINILKNALDAVRNSPPDKRIVSVKAIESSEETTRLEIYNYGSAISVDGFTRLFDPYYTTKPEGEGLGLGLFTAKMIVETNMGGRIYCENKPNGVSFFVEVANGKEEVESMGMEENRSDRQT